MTSVAERKTRLSFTTSDTIRYRGRERQVVIEASPFLAGVRLKGSRQRHFVSWGGIYNLAVKLAAEKSRSERRQRRRAA